MTPEERAEARYISDDPKTPAERALSAALDALDHADAQRLAAERGRDEARQALLSVRSYLESIHCSGPCDSLGICAKCSANSETYTDGTPSLMRALSERDTARAQVETLAAALREIADDAGPWPERTIALAALRAAGVKK